MAKSYESHPGLFAGSALQAGTENNRGVWDINQTEDSDPLSPDAYCRQFPKRYNELSQYIGSAVQQARTLQSEPQKTVIKNAMAIQTTLNGLTALCDDWKRYNPVKKLLEKAYVADQIRSYERTIEKLIAIVEKTLSKLN